MTRRRYLYCLIFPNGKRYLGITFNLRARLGGHVKFSGGRLPVQKAMAKYGAENVRLEILVIGSSEYISALEVSAIKAYGTRDRALGYNCAEGGSKWAVELNKGKRASPETRLKMSAAQRGRKKTAEHKARLRESNLGQKRSAITRARIGNVVRGRKLSDVTRAKMSKAHLGRPLSMSHLQKIAEGKIRRNQQPVFDRPEGSE